MRDIVVTLIILGSIPFIFRRPYIGIMVWSWIGYMNPHRLAYGFAQSMPFALIIAAVTILAILFSKEPKKIPVTGVTVVWIAFLLWMVITTQFAFYPKDASVYLGSVLKIQFVTFLTLMLINTRQRIEMLIWVIVLSIGFYSVKGGLFTLATGGASRVFGPPGGMIEENNSLALATLMTIPLMYYLRERSQNWKLRLLLLTMMGLSAVSVLGSQSRGAVVAAVFLAFAFWIKSKRKLLTAIVLVLLIPPLVMFMPESWHERVATMVEDRQADVTDIEAMQLRGGGGALSAPIPSRDRLGYWPKDFSALGRVNAWNYAINIANSRLTGAGFESWSPETFERYAPIVEEFQGGHSIFFSVLADHGWPGLIMFLTILLMTWRSASKTIKRARSVPELEWIAELLRMIQLSMIAYCVAGAFLSLAYFDLPWHLISIVLLCGYLVKQHGVPPSGSRLMSNARQSRPAAQGRSRVATAPSE